ncbi:Heme d1 biosynthesis protein (NirH) [Oleispira antarctica RB-8]|uniref:siroheme decarboxylase n=1 Tax=Oleispira antarctica RB-8 TaxID=698738 RepID=R4YU66_OLEAN|nr:Heme d1 biosynthesis protein (NirH) [Oleispira antarctica RB-8]
MHCKNSNSNNVVDIDSFNPKAKSPFSNKDTSISTTDTVKIDFILTEVDRALVVATQEGLPVSERPYQIVGEKIGISEDEVICRLEKMLERGVIRRIAVVPNHYRIGFKANGMTVWNVKDSDVKRLGRQIGELPYVSHCYQRPRHEPYWSYNLFAMVHGTERAQVEERAEKLKALLGDACLGSEILYSSKILKKTGMRLSKKDDNASESKKTEGK